jgi:hypothetical protein
MNHDTDIDRVRVITTGNDGLAIRRDAVRALNHHSAVELDPATERFGVILSQSAHFSMFPLARPKGTTWTRENPWGWVSIQSGLINSGTNGAPVDAGLPAGGLPRLLLAYITTEARRIHKAGGDPTHIDLTTSLRRMTTSLGLKPGSRNRAVLDQLQATLSARVTFAPFKQSAVRAGKPGEWRHTAWQQSIASSLSLWIPEQQPLNTFEPYITLSPEWLEHVLDDSKVLPARLDVLAQLAGKPMAFDVLTWLTNVTYSLARGRQTFKDFYWQDLAASFTHDYDRLTNFRMKWRAALVEALRYYPEAQVNPDYPHPTDKRQTVVRVIRAPLFIEPKRR